MTDAPASDLPEDLELYRSDLCAFIRNKLPDATNADIDDIVQDVLTDTFHRYFSRERTSNARNPWEVMKRIASNKCSDWILQKSQDRSFHNTQLAATTIPSVHSDSARQDPDTLSLLQMIKHASERPYEVFMLRMLKWNYKAIAKRLGISISTVYVHFHNAAELIRREWEGRQLSN